MTLVRATDGTVNLHLWRHGEEYLTQKGPVFLKEWNNIIFATIPGKPLPNTRYVDLSARPLQFADETFDSVYAYHVFEHLTLEEGVRLAREILRVLRPGGNFRLSVPDLEEFCREYLTKLEIAWKDRTPTNVVRYQWAAMCIFEQMVREREGGLMCEMVLRGEYDEAQLRQHCLGDTLRGFLESAKSARRFTAEHATGNTRLRLSERLRSLTPGTFVRALFRRARELFGSWSSRPADPRVIKETVRWMYDRLSLRLLLESSGFTRIELATYMHSSIPDWSHYDFDRSIHGDYPIDPSVYIEGKKTPADQAGERAVSGRERSEPATAP